MRRLAALIVLAALALSAVPAGAAGTRIDLRGGEKVDVRCAGEKLGVWRRSETRAQLNCKTPSGPLSSEPTASGATRVDLRAGDSLDVHCAGEKLGAWRRSETRVQLSCRASASPPPAGGYFKVLPPLAALPSDGECAGRVRRSTWEPRPQNARANAAHPPVGYKVDGYGGMKHPDQTWGRVTGQANGTTDELIQHYACKWGLPDDVMRAQMVGESSWYQGLKDANGNPIDGKGYGDFGDCSGGPYGSSGPASFGVMQIKWCAHPGTVGYSERSTAFNLDYYGAVIRGCYNGWDYVTSTQGDLWGCVGRWYSGRWHDAAADGYIGRRKVDLAERAWERPGF